MSRKSKKIKKIMTPRIYEIPDDYLSHQPGFTTEGSVLKPGAGSGNPLFAESVAFITKCNFFYAITFEYERKNPALSNGAAWLHYVVCLSRDDNPPVGHALPRPVCRLIKKTIRRLEEQEYILWSNSMTGYDGTLVTSHRTFEDALLRITRTVGAGIADPLGSLEEDTDEDAGEKASDDSSEDDPGSSPHTPKKPDPRRHLPLN